MHIVYDVRNYGGAHGGIARYIAELASGMADIGSDTVTFLAPIYSEPLFRNLDQVEIVGRYVRPFHRGRRLAAEINGIAARFYLRSRTPEVIHEMFYYRKAASPRKGVTVVTVYDMITEKYSATSETKNLVRRRWDRSVKIEAIRRADHVICISASTRTDVLEMLDLEPAKVSVIHLGCRITNQIPEPRLMDGPYLLYVGNRKSYKNFGALLLAYSRSKHLAQNFRLVCFGGGPFCREERLMIASSGLRPNAFIQMGGDDELLASLYSRAAALVYPSLYEGFGLPPLEAMAYGCPVVCSNTSSLPEVVGAAAELFDPTNVDEITSSIERVVLSETRAKALREAGRVRAELFSWKECAQKTRAIYEAIL